MSDKDVASQRILDGTSWESFCDTLKLAGLVMQRPKSPERAFDRAEGYRYLSRITRAALETFVEHADPLAPVLQRVVHETAKMGSDNPDNFYQNAAISGAHRYRLHGTRGTVPYLSLATQRGHYGQGQGMPPTGFLDASHLSGGGEGRVEVIISREQPETGNWLPMEEDTGTLIVRQTFGDRAGEQIADLKLERLGGDSRPGPLTPAAIDEGLQSASRLVAGAAALFATWAEGFMAHTNQLPRFDDAVSRRFGGDPLIAYYHSYWQLGPEEALVIDATPPVCEHWNFQLNNHWMESLDYRYFPIHVNKATARYRPDGSVRIIVAHRDPQLPETNWIDTVGHDRGTMCFRWVRAVDHPQPQTRVVAWESLASMSDP